MTVAEIRAKLKPFNLSHVAKATGIKYAVLRGIVVNNRKAGYEDVQKIIDFLKQISA
jgi:hypothetical protein